ncbi:hypothetical protein C0993_004415 [Termitomyces sp. T159_Od127]|nr:hypothetical protein C0993_004415 [Termitomyces sp. T159_Od127]
MAWQSFPLLLFTTWSLFSALVANSQTISTDTSVPPLQWLNLSNLLQGSSSPPPLKNAAIGYDETSRSLIIFGGESASGLVQSQTFLLNLETLTWSVPNPPNNLQRIPAARSAAIYGTDLAASNRQGFIVAGGKGPDGNSLTDVWEYDFINQFWSEVNVLPGPLPRWGAVGGIDLATPPVQDPSVPGPNHTFYLVGGYDGIHPSSLSDVWKLSISGTLSSNLPSDTDGSWDHQTVGNLPSKFNVSGTVVGHQVVLTGGCSSLSQKGACAEEQDSYVIDTQRQTATQLSVCPAPRAGPVLVRNSNGFTSTFASQVYLLLGTLNETRWNDDDGLKNGEVAILDIQTGTWSRILPSGDPGSSGQVTFPSPRKGSAAFSYPQALVGSSRTISSDTLIFGGQDSSGNFLSEIWLLRAYNGLLSQSQNSFGDGHLQTGINANGAGRGFEVVNRPLRTRKASLLGVPTVDGAQERLREMNWLQRRRSLNTVGELDYALTQVRREQLSTPATTDGLMIAAPPFSSQPRPTVSEMVIHAIIQALLLGLSILTLIYLWLRAPKYGFVIFLVWTLTFYAIMIYFALRHRTECSFSYVLCSLHNSPVRNTPADPNPPSSLTEVNPGPYAHQPLYRLATAADEISSCQDAPRSTETDGHEDDLDDDTRQRIIEEEIGRRDVSIITIPRRKLWIVNP